MCCVALYRAGSAQPVAYDTPYDDDDQPGSEGHHEQHQQGGEARGVQHKGPGGLMGHMYNRKLEQAQQVTAAHRVLAKCIFGQVCTVKLCEAPFFQTRLSESEVYSRTSCPSSFGSDACSWPMK